MFTITLTGDQRTYNNRHDKLQSTQCTVTETTSCFITESKIPLGKSRVGQQQQPKRGGGGGGGGGGWGEKRVIRMHLGVLAHPHPPSIGYRSTLLKLQCVGCDVARSTQPPSW